MRLIDADKIEPHEHLESFSNNHAEYAMVAYMDDINALPTVDAVQVVHGRWKAVTEDMVTYKRICSCCGKEAPYDIRDEDPLSEGYYMLYPYCPWCGAKMDGKDGDGHERF